MDALLKVDTAVFMLVALVSMLAHGYKKYLMREIAGNIIDWYIVHPRATGLAIFYCVTGILGLVFQGVLSDYMVGGQIITAAFTGYSADTLNTQTPKAPK